MGRAGRSDDWESVLDLVDREPLISPGEWADGERAMKERMLRTALTRLEALRATLPRASGGLPPSLVELLSELQEILISADDGRLSREIAWQLLHTSLLGRGESDPRQMIARYRYGLFVDEAPLAASQVSEAERDEIIDTVGTGLAQFLAGVPGSPLNDPLTFPTPEAFAKSIVSVVQERFWKAIAVQGAESLHRLGDAERLDTVLFGVYPLRQAIMKTYPDQADLRWPGRAHTATLLAVAARAANENGSLSQDEELRGVAACALVTNLAPRALHQFSSSYDSQADALADSRNNSRGMRGAIGALATKFRVPYANWPALT